MMTRAVYNVNPQQPSIRFDNRNIFRTFIRIVSAATLTTSAGSFVLNKTDHWSFPAASNRYRCFPDLGFALSGFPVDPHYRTICRNIGLRPTSSSFLRSARRPEIDSEGKPMEDLCVATLRVCEALKPTVEALYQSINGSQSDDKVKSKADESIFTIADGLVQYLFTEVFFGNNVVGDIVGEEDCLVTLRTKPYRVDDLVVSPEFEKFIDEAIHGVQTARKELMAASSSDYLSLTAFIDPIDGTREFSTQKGEQCTICVGYADTNSGEPVAGVVYRPLSTPEATWAMGAKSEGFASSNLIRDSTKNRPDACSLLTTNGKISPFLEALMEEMNYGRTPSGGAGNKMLLLLEGNGSAYIQDRGVSRWDTCGAQAVLEAHGGMLCRLDRFIDNDDASNAGYTYRKTTENLDFVSGLSRLTKYNAANGFDSDASFATDATEVKPYANLCGLVALSEQHNDSKSKDEILQALRKAAAKHPPAYD